jgi:hypothetical protein
VLTNTASSPLRAPKWGEEFTIAVFYTAASKARGQILQALQADVRLPGPIFTALDSSQGVPLRIPKGREGVSAKALVIMVAVLQK